MKLLKGMDESVLEGIADRSRPLALPCGWALTRLQSSHHRRGSASHRKPQDVSPSPPRCRLIVSFRLGYKVGILSGGFTYFAQKLQKEVKAQLMASSGLDSRRGIDLLTSQLGIDYVYANQLDFKDGKLTGEV